MCLHPQEIQTCARGLKMLPPGIETADVKTLSLLCQAPSPKICLYAESMKTSKACS
jgi:hypothetical protein